MKSVPFLPREISDLVLRVTMIVQVLFLNRTIIGLQVSKIDDDIQQLFTKVKRPGIYHRPPTHSISEIFK